MDFMLSLMICNISIPIGPDDILFKKIFLIYMIKQAFTKISTHTECDGVKINREFRHDKLKKNTTHRFKNQTRKPQLVPIDPRNSLNT